MQMRSGVDGIGEWDAGERDRREDSLHVQRQGEKEREDAVGREAICGEKNSEREGRCAR
jgi:hypothetical protein